MTYVLLAFALLTSAGVLTWIALERLESARGVISGLSAGSWESVSRTLILRANGLGDEISDRLDR